LFGWLATKKGKKLKRRFYLKLLFYSIISNYWTLWKLGLIKKTGTVVGEGLLTGWEKCSNVLVLSSLLFGLDF